MDKINCKQTKRLWLCGAGWLGLSVLYLLMSSSGRMHWDECFYLHSVRGHTVAGLMQLEAGLSDSNVFPPFFFSAKVGLIVLLRGLVLALGDGAAAMAFIQGVFAGLMVALAAANILLLCELFGVLEGRRWDVAVLVMLHPLSLYLGYKVLSEGPSLLLATLAMIAFSRSLRTQSGLHWVWRGLCILLLAGATLLRMYSLLSLPIIAITILVIRKGRSEVMSVVWWAIVVGVASLVLAAGVGALMGVNLLASAAGPVVHVLAKPKVDWAARAYALVLFFQFLAVPLLLALIPPLSRTTRVALMWMVLGAVPFLSGHEPRYYSLALLPSAWLAAQGCRRLVHWLGLERREVLASGALLGALVLGNQVLLMPLTPYEVDQRALDAAVRQARASYPQASLVFPWHVDYAYIRFTQPDAPAILALDTEVDGPVVASPAFLAWVGQERYLPSVGLTPSADEPWLYVAWGYNPTILRLRSMLRRVGINYLPDLESSNLMHHGATSSLWDDGSYWFEEMLTESIYTIYRVHPNAPASP